MNPQLQQDALILREAANKTIGERVNTAVNELAAHYELPRAQMEITLLGLITQEMLSLIPEGETSSNRETFTQRVTCRHQLFQEAVERGIQLMVEVEEETGAMRQLNRQLSMIIGKLNQPKQSA